VLKVGGTDRSMTFGEVAGAAYFPPDGYPLDILEPGLEETAFYDPVNFTFPGGRHVAEVEIDPDTGELALVAYTAVDDVGVVLNPMIVEGQIHGGVVQGVGQPLGENCVYDPVSGQLLTGSYMDYRMPRADDLPQIAVSTQSTRCRHNPIGVKGCGEVGTIASPATVMNAVVDALSPYGIAHLDMPATPQRIWDAIWAAGQPASA
jgi:carbon-monoxide dehydrogenase large subunit